jgi:hypothetical protein
MKFYKKMQFSLLLSLTINISFLLMGKKGYEEWNETLVPRKTLAWQANIFAYTTRANEGAELISVCKTNVITFTTFTLFPMRN